jgi:glutaredoxin
MGFCKQASSTCKYCPKPVRHAGHLQVSCCLFSSSRILSVLIKALRIGLGQLIIFIDFITRPRQIKRSAEAQAVVNQAAASLSLYQFRACPFCVRTRRVIRQLNLPIALLDAMNDAVARETLLAEGGAIKVPCLRIDDNGSVTWMYESKVIIAYLQQRFA